MPLNPEQVTDLPAVANSDLSDIYYAVQNGLSVQETGLQLATMALNYTMLNYPGDPNTFVAGVRYQMCFDTVNKNLYVCIFTGDATNAIWTLVSSTLASVVDPTHGGTGVSNPTAYTLPVANGTQPFLFEGPLTNGQLLIGRTGNSPVAANITGGANITVTNSSGGITISAPSAAVFNWTEVTGTTQAIAIDNGYVASNSSQVVFTLPAIAPFGSLITIKGKGTGGWKIEQGVGQTIFIGSAQSTLGSLGFIQSFNYTDAVQLMCITANTTWSNIAGPQGVIDVS